MSRSLERERAYFHDGTSSSIQGILLSQDFFSDERDGTAAKDEQNVFAREFFIPEDLKFRKNARTLFRYVLKLVNDDDFARLGRMVSALKAAGQSRKRCWGL